MALDATPLNLNNLPVVLAGPILRRLTRTSVSVWCALSVPGDVTLHVQQFGQPATEQTVVGTPRRIGRNLWLILLTLDGADFQAGTTYEYFLSSPGWPAPRSPDWNEYGYRGAARPTFVGIAQNIADFVVLHSSCRRPHANKRDGLAHAHRLLAEIAQPRPHLLILSGDQIYADDVASVLMPRIRRIAADLVDIDESNIFNPLPPIGGRQAQTLNFGLSSDEAKDHIWMLAEFYALYLLSWSEALWPANLPLLADADANEVALQINSEENPQLDAEIWDNETANLTLFRTTLPDIRRLLANVPTLMIFDDHEVTDDWNLDFNWCRDVYSSDQGSRIISNGLISYALFQHWGNQPARFNTPNTPEQATITAATWTSTDHPLTTTPNLNTSIGMPAANLFQQPFPANGLDMRDLTASTGIRYDFSLNSDDGFPKRLVFLDERTARHLPEDDKPAGRIAPAALDQMWPAPQGVDADTPTLLIAPAPVLGLHIIEHVLQPLFALKDKGEQERDYEGWGAYGATFEHLLDRLGEYRRVTILSGDVHFGYTKALSYSKPSAAPNPARTAQFVASASKYSMGLTVMLHLAGDLAQKTGIVRTRTFHGYTALSQAQRDALESAPPAGSVLPYDDLADTLLGRVLRDGQEQPAVFSAEVATAYNLGPPDWEYTIDHISDERPSPPGDLLNAMNQAAANGTWDGWNRSNAIDMVRALRASDLHQIGRVFVGLPLLARISFTNGAGLTAQQELFVALGEEEPGPVFSTVTAVNLG